MVVAKIKIEGKAYTLQHPGAKWALDIQNEIQNGNGTINVTKVFEEGFEHCVFPEEGGKLTIQDFDDNMKEIKIWSDVLTNWMLDQSFSKKRVGFTVLEEPKKKVIQS